MSEVKLFTIYQGFDGGTITLSGLCSNTDLDKGCDGRCISTNDGRDTKMCKYFYLSGTFSLLPCGQIEEEYY